MERPLAHALAVGRIGEDEIVGRLRRCLPEPCRIPPPDLAAADEAEVVGIAANEPSRLSGFLDELAEAGTAREGFEPKRTGAGKEIEHPGVLERKVFDAVSENIEDRLAHPVGGRPRVPPRGRAEATAFEASADDPDHRCRARS